MKHAHITVYLKPGQDINSAIRLLNKKRGLSGLKKEMRKHEYFIPKRQRKVKNGR